MSFNPRLTVFLFLTLFLVSAFAPVSYAQNENSAENAKITNIRYGRSKDGMRIVIDLSKKCDYDLYSIKDSSRVYLDIFDAEVTQAAKQTCPADPLIAGCTFSQYNFRQARMRIKLKYGIPIDNVNIFTLKNPERIVLDIHRDCNNFVQFHITKNILWLQNERAMNGKFILINEVFVDPKSPDVKIDVELAGNSGKSAERIDAMVKRTGAIVGINGGYFGGGSNLGLVVIDGKIKASSVKKRPPRTAFAMSDDGQVWFDRLLDKNGQIVNKQGKQYKSVKMAVGGGPRLLSRGKPNVNAREEGLGKGGNDITRRTGRTAIGITPDGKIGMFTFSSFRNNHSDGLKLEEAAAYLQSRKIHEATNLDGGGSTSMSVMGYLVSKAPGHSPYQRPVANGILIYDKSPIISPYYLATDPQSLILPADGKTVMNLKVIVCDKKENPVPDKTPVSVTSGLGLFDKKYYYTQNGMLTIKVRSVRAPGNYTIKLECGPIQKFIPVKLMEGDPASLLVMSCPADGNGAKQLNCSETDDQDDDEDNNNTDQKNNGSDFDETTSSPSPSPSASSSPGNGNGKNETKTDSKVYSTPAPDKTYIIKALVRDADKNSLKGRTVKFELADGKGSFSSSSVITKFNGLAFTSFTRESEKAKIKITVGNLPPVFVEL
ncbi:MAG: phosphodiester glycosidase family protein [Firmicutes bacterium]|nr:phosphodiester glycosidase family protein [Bacillota bacterium]